MTDGPPGFADILRDRTAALHAQAERSGIVHAILVGGATRAGYALLLRSLLPAYRALEASLALNSTDAVVAPLYRREVLRVPALEHDLALLAGPDWADTLPVVPPGDEYARRVTNAAESSPELLIAHVYTRYLGDLSGGAILKARLSKVAHLREECLTFYAFPEVADTRAFAREYRAAIDAAGRRARAPAGIVDEALGAFELNIALSEAVQRCASIDR